MCSGLEILHEGVYEGRRFVLVVDWFEVQGLSHYSWSCEPIQIPHPKQRWSFFGVYVLGFLEVSTVINFVMMLCFWHFIFLCVFLDILLVRLFLLEELDWYFFTTLYVTSFLTISTISGAPLHPSFASCWMRDNILHFYLVFFLERIYHGKIEFKELYRCFIIWYN